MTNFSANQILREINYLRFTNAKIVILTILEVLNFDLSKFEQLSSPKFTKIQSLETLKLPKMAIFSD